MTEVPVVRYDRQLRIWGADGQRKLGDSSVCVFGDDWLAAYTALPLVALGFGEVRIVGSRKADLEERFLDKSVSGPVVLAWSDIFKEVNPNCEVIGIYLPVDSRLANAYSKGVKFVVDTANSPASKAARLCSKPENFFGGVDSQGGKLRPFYGGKLLHDDFLPEYASSQDPLFAMLFGGIIAEELKRIVLGERALEREISYRDDRAFVRPDLRALVVGCGALGNIASVCLSHLGLKRVDFMDFDFVESHNLNRQVLFYDSVGKSKAETVAVKFCLMNPKAESRAICERFNGCGVVDFSNYDVIFDFVDNRYTRASILAEAVKKKRTVIAAASSPNSCNVAVYVPGRTSCFEHVYSNYYGSALVEERARRQSCVQEPDPSVIMTNQIAAALAVLELTRLSNPLNGSIKYDASLPPRIGVNKLKSVCSCEANSVPCLEVK
jgi:molybdopterin/thiamine biosynthesis adenylyltransferase